MLEILYCIHCRLIGTILCESLLHEILSGFTFRDLQQCGYAQLHVTDVILCLLILHVQTNSSNMKNWLSTKEFPCTHETCVGTCFMHETVMIHAQHRTLKEHAYTGLLLCMYFHSPVAHKNTPTHSCNISSYPLIIYIHVLN